MLMPQIKTFSRFYSLPKCIPDRGELFDIRQCCDLKSGENRGVKIFRKAELDEHRLNLIKKEITLMRDLDHPNIIKVHDIIEDVSKIYLIIDEIKGQNLFQYILYNQ
jgi:calcium-dependent protein kinase